MHGNAKSQSFPLMHFSDLELDDVARCCVGPQKDDERKNFASGFQAILAVLSKTDPADL